MKQTRRGLSEQFRRHLKEGGCLHPLLRRVQGDATLDMEIRADYLNVYYRGGSLLKVSRATGKTVSYRFEFDKNYGLKKDFSKVVLPDPKVATVSDAAGWMDAIGPLKDTMDLWFGGHPKDERALQQMVVWENNDSPWANGTDWFIVDIEYDNRQGARFDLVGLRWDSDASARKLAKGYLPRLSIVEMKAGDGALSGNAGVEDHLTKWRAFLNDSGRVRRFKDEMLDVFSQKRELGLIKALRSNGNHVGAFDPEIELIFLIAGHDPASRKLGDILRRIQASGQPELPQATVSLCTANFMGFGLYRENVHALSAFVQRYENQSGG